MMCDFDIEEIEEIDANVLFMPVGSKKMCPICQFASDPNQLSRLRAAIALDRLCDHETKPFSYHAAKSGSLQPLQLLNENCCSLSGAPLGAARGGRLRVFYWLDLNAPAVVDAAIREPGILAAAGRGGDVALVRLLISRSPNLLDDVRFCFSEVLVWRLPQHMDTPSSRNICSV
jgi:hypothetical protein